MKYILLTITLFFIFSSFANSQQSDDEPWQLSKDKNGIKVFTRKTLKSSLKDSRATVTINASANKAYELFIDFERHRDWMDRVKASRLLKKADDEFIVYYEVSAPWPVANRDLPVQYKIVKLENGGFRMEVVAKPDYIPENKSYVRISESESTWEFIPKGKNSVEVIFTNHSDPGGGVPDWLVNATATDNPFNTLSNLRKKLEEK